jgi:hypothetical protein
VLLPASSPEGAALPHAVPPDEGAAVLFPMSHAPVFDPSSGETHGAQRSSAWQTSCGRSVEYCATCGTHTLRHTPAALFSDLHVGGAAPPDSMSESGMHTPPEQLASALVSVPDGTSALGTQWAAPVVQQLGRLEMSIGAAGAVGVGTHVFPVVDALVVVARPASPAPPLPAIGSPMAEGADAHPVSAKSPETTKARASPVRCMGAVLTDDPHYKVRTRCACAWADGVKRTQCARIRL